jgi:hypothetical protein
MYGCDGRDIYVPSGLIAAFDSCDEHSYETLLDDIGADPDQLYWYWICFIGTVYDRFTAIELFRQFS